MHGEEKKTGEWEKRSVGGVILEGMAYQTCHDVVTDHGDSLHDKMQLTIHNCFTKNPCSSFICPAYELRSHTTYVIQNTIFLTIKHTARQIFNRKSCRQIKILQFSTYFQLSPSYTTTIMHSFSLGQTRDL